MADSRTNGPVGRRNISGLTLPESVDELPKPMLHYPRHWRVHLDYAEGHSIAAAV
jgi:hypothetical protein